MKRTLEQLALIVSVVGLLSTTIAAEEPALFRYLQGNPPALMITYTPSELDPRQEVNNRRVTTTSLRKDLEALRPAFDGLVLYGYNESSTPRTVALAKELGFRAVLLAVWEIRSAAELDGVAALAEQFGKDMAVGIIVGNEGLTFNRYEEEDLRIAERRLRHRLGKTVPLTTSEPLVGYQRKIVREFGDFLAPNIHPVFDRENLAAEAAAAWVHDEAAKLASQTNKPVLVKETGFPHDGKPAYTPTTQQAFWTAYTRGGTVRKVDATFVFHGVAFEAFDLPWKAEESKLVIEKSWGLLSVKREPYPSFATWKALRDAAK